jgi:hypothetical protein
LADFDLSANSTQEQAADLETGLDSSSTISNSFDIPDSKESNAKLESSQPLATQPNIQQAVDLLLKAKSPQERQKLATLFQKGLVIFVPDKFFKLISNNNLHKQPSIVSVLHLRYSK